jgi:DNA-binding GntR family transcriptional regulator
MDVDTRVHRTLYRCTHNTYLEATIGQYYNLALRIWCLFFDRWPDVAEHIDEHAALLEAVIAGDADRADRLAVAHVDHFEQAIRGAIENVRPRRANAPPTRRHTALRRPLRT